MSLTIPEAGEMRVKAESTWAARVEHCALGILKCISLAVENGYTLTYLDTMAANWPPEILDAALALFPEKGYVIERSTNNSTVVIHWER